jgi:catechol 2,3-dioxygenase-like lactoylglutathione lyase family enzyme
MTAWISSTLVFVRDVDHAILFYVDRLGFTLDMRHAEAGTTLVAGVSRGEGCALLLTCQWPDRVGTGILYTALDPDEFERLATRLNEQGLSTADGWWGLPLLVVTDPDGNLLYFPRP